MKSLNNILKSSKNIRSNVSDSKSIFKRRRLMNGPKSRTPLIFTNVAFEDYIDSFSPSEEKESISRNSMTQSQLGVFEFGNPETQEDCDFFCEVKSIQSELSSSAPEFIPKHLSKASEKSVTSDDAESLCEENPQEELSNNQSFECAQSYRDLFSSVSEEENIANSEVITCLEEFPLTFSDQASEHDHSKNFNDTSDQDSNHVSQKEEFLNTKAFTFQLYEFPEPRFSREEKEKWLESNHSSIPVIAGNSMRRDPQKKSKVFQNKEPRLVKESCKKRPKTKKGSTFSASVPIFENFNEKFKSLSCKTVIGEFFKIMHVLSNHFHHSSCLVINPKNKGSKEKQGHFGNSNYQKNKTNQKDVVTYFKHANIKGPNWKWVPKSSVAWLKKKKHVSTWYVDSGCLRHMTGSSVAFGGNQKGKIKGYGIIVKGEITVNQVSYVDSLKHNLISVSQLCDNGMDVMFKIKFCIMYKADTLTEVMRANRRGDLYLLCFDSFEAKEEICLMSSVKNEEA
ncbi:hypothetical protein OSB04_012398 [Centaurea solstitialis]|uniref:Retrovirus-related Pol polyprotein from transposon TNT 1-94-like beta-barrel domain-containing protein n=1 Tax=Centaurea solstitialis TaxID=347529 RepID=A0AA38TD05_9ASTR|nr:hypothetical protein OSB04_012398 [Centaurea solstitialis]